MMAPPGRHVLSCFCQYAPYAPQGRSWDDGLREEFADRVLATLGAYAPNLPGAVIARQMLSPLDLERRFGLTGGHIFHGEITPDQGFALRPLSGHADYRTPLPGLYLCGSGTHPGGGVTGIPATMRRRSCSPTWRDVRAAPDRPRGRGLAPHPPPCENSRVRPRRSRRHGHR
jgi:phytoene dehydrogenase-like protein